MADFIQTEEFRLAGEEGEQRVFEAVKAAFAGRDTLGWWRYPLISEKSVREPDILLLDAELGVVIIEVKSLQLEQIAGVSGYEWNMAPNAYFGRAQINPYQQAKAQLQVIMNTLRGRVGLDRVPGRVVVATPMITRDEWDDASFNVLLGATPMLFGDQLTPTKLMRALERTQLVAQGQALDEAQWAALTWAFGTSGNIPKPKNIAPVVVPPCRRPAPNWWLSVPGSSTGTHCQNSAAGAAVNSGAGRERRDGGTTRSILVAKSAAQAGSAS